MCHQVEVFLSIWQNSRTGCCAKWALETEGISRKVTGSPTLGLPYLEDVGTYAALFSYRGSCFTAGTYWKLSRAKPCSCRPHSLLPLSEGSTGSSSGAKRCWFPTWDTGSPNILSILWKPLNFSELAQCWLHCFIAWDKLTHETGSRYFGQCSLRCDGPLWIGMEWNLPIIKAFWCNGLFDRHYPFQTRIPSTEKFQQKAEVSRKLTCAEALWDHQSGHNFFLCRHHLYLKNAVARGSGWGGRILRNNLES